MALVTMPYKSIRGKGGRRGRGHSGPEKTLMAVKPKEGHRFEGKGTEGVVLKILGEHL